MTFQDNKENLANGVLNIKLVGSLISALIVGTIVGIIWIYNTIIIPINQLQVQNLQTQALILDQKTSIAGLATRVSALEIKINK